MIRYFLLSVIVFNLPLAAADTALLTQAGQRVKKFWDDLASVSCTETLLQEKLNEKGKVILNWRTRNDYLLSLHWDAQGMLLDESRVPVAEPRKKAPASALLVTSGFASMLLIFHPEFQSSFTFTMLPDEDAGDHKVARVGFLYRNGTPSPGVLAVRGSDYPIAWEGTAWIDPQTAVVTHIQAHWRDPAAEIGLQSLSADVVYAPVESRDAHAYWLPASARIDLETRRQHWRNTHTFSSYKFFSVDTDSSKTKVVEGGKQ